MSTEQDPLTDYFGTPQEFNDLMRLMETNPEFKDRTVDYLNMLLSDKPTEERKAISSDYEAYLQRIDFQRHGIDDALGDWLEGGR